MITYRHMFLDFAVLDAPAIFEVLEEFQEKGHIHMLDYSFDNCTVFDDRLQMKILDVSFEEAMKIADVLREADLSVMWMHDEVEP